ncbi:MAG: hypothetical protein V2I33_19040, partial [Kangiellaceae bacterium]|nr:hypothetical protein [Kangiellaceae bacterium]
EAQKKSLKKSEEALKRLATPSGKARSLTEDEKAAVQDGIESLERIVSAEESGLKDEEKKFVEDILEKTKSCSPESLSDADRKQLAKAMSLVSKKEKKSDSDQIEEVAESDEAGEAAETLKTLSWLASDGSDKVLSDEQASALVDSVAALKKALESGAEELGVSDSDAKKALNVLRSLETKKPGDVVNPEQLKALGSVTKMVEQGRAEMEAAAASKKAIEELEESEGTGRVEAKNAGKIADLLADSAAEEPQESALKSAIEKLADSKTTSEAVELSSDEQAALKKALEAKSTGPLAMSVAEKAGLDEAQKKSLKKSEEALKRLATPSGKARSLTEDEKAAVQDG